MGLFDNFYKGLFDFGKKETKIQALTQENLELKRTAFDNQAMAFSNMIANFNRTIGLVPSFDITDHENRYTTTDDIYSIIKRLSQTAALVPLYGYIVTKDTKSLNRLLHVDYKHLKPKNYKEIQTKALTDLPEEDPVAKLLEKPHELMSKFEFFVELYSWLFLDGECFLWKQRPDNGKNQGMTINLQFMPPKCVTLNVTETYPQQVVAYDYKIDGNIVKENIPASDVIHIKYFNPNTNYLGDGLRGLSPIKVLARRLTRLDSNMNVSVAQLQNGGVESIVYEKGLMGTEAVEIVGQRKDNFYRFSSNSANAGQPFFASGEMGAIQLGSHLADMGITDLANIDFKKLCNAYGVSDRLFNNDATGSEISDDNARKGLYTNCVLPNIFMVRDSLIHGLLPDFKDGVMLTDEQGEQFRIPGDGKKRFIDTDISDITELNEDMGKQVTALEAAWWLTANEKREAMNYERFENTLFDEPLIPSGYVPLDDLLLPDPVEVVTENGN